MDRPLVSVIVASYNRSNVLALALQSVLAQTREDWELLLVDDGSTDDTEQVVDQIGDDRIRFVPLGANFGDQSGPNNVGMLLARGSLLAFLNHDDLWFPDHLEHGLAVRDRTGADLCFARMAVLRPTDTASLEAGAWSFRLKGRGHDGRYRPGDDIPASGWLFRRELVPRVGLWRSAHEVYATASMDWLFRAWRAGASLVSTDLESVITIASGSRRNAYRDRLDEENRFFATALASPGPLRERIRACVEDELPVPAGATRRQARNLRLARRLRHLRQDTSAAALARLGINPMEVRYALHHRGPGRYFDELTRRRGLGP